MGRQLILFSLFFLMAPQLIAQKNENDSSISEYYEEYPDLVGARLYTSRKYTSFMVKDGVTRVFEPNSTLNLGIGATYNNFTLNLAFGLGIMNPGRQDVNTTYLDLQAHAYPENWVIDLFGQFYTGYRVSGSSLSMPNDENENFLAPDLRLRKIGANVQRLLNGENLSLQAAFQQSAWQKRSAGSLMAGFEMYGGRVLHIGDDNLVFDDIPLLSGQPFLSYFQFGPNVGYAGTLVLFKHFFITGVASVNYNFGYSSFENDSDPEVNWGFNHNYFLRAFVGYNSANWSINTNYVHNNIGLVDFRDASARIMTGNYRVNFIYRFQPSKKSRPYFDFVNPKTLLGR